MNENTKWNVGTTICLISLYVFLILNDTNTLPKYDNGIFDPIVKDQKAFFPQALQLVNMGGLTHRHMGEDTDAHHTHGLSLANLKPSSIMSNTNNGHLIPKGFIIDPNSTIISLNDYLVDIPATKKGEHLIFDNTGQIRWDIDQYVLNSIQYGKTLIGNMHEEAHNTLITGDISLDSSGKTAISENAINGRQMTDSSISLNKLSDTGESDYHILTCDTNEPSWSITNQIQLESYPIISKGPSIIGTSHTLCTHQINLTNDGNQSKLTCRGSVIGGTGQVELRCSISIGGNQFNLSHFETSIFDWIIYSYIIRLTDNSGFVYFNVVTDDTTNLYSAEITGVDWNETSSTNIICSSNSNINNVECYLSKISTTRPRQIS